MLYFFHKYYSVVIRIQKGVLLGEMENQTTI